VNDLPKLSRLHRALSRDPKVRLGSLVSPFGERMQSEQETLDLLLATHSPNSSVMERGMVPTAACRAKRLDWWVAVRIITYRRVEWVIDSFAPYKSPGIDGIFPAVVQEGREILIPYLVRIFRTCLATGYVPAVWCRLR
jgi:hypothetical protein